MKYFIGEYYLNISIMYITFAMKSSNKKYKNRIFSYIFLQFWIFFSVFTYILAHL